ncbi:DUF4288 domain-containing protein [Okeanomitos corallinicola TIOX110]|uniref:DUF4288 domain-containing protein n=1 Tax=Okeanomitos corallinicola TIOX110 TaxID=3133117 RepID=A0ABZ2UMJ6_9CYAN
MYVKFADGNQNKYPIWENIILIEANSDEEALEKAETRAKEDESESEDDFTWENRSASLIFAGIRKLISCNNPDENPHHGTEISYSQMEVKTEDELSKLVKGESVTIIYEE